MIFIDADVHAYALSHAFTDARVGTFARRVTDGIFLHLKLPYKLMAFDHYRMLRVYGHVDVSPTRIEYGHYFLSLPSRLYSFNK